MHFSNQIPPLKTAISLIALLLQAAVLNGQHWVDFVPNEGQWDKNVVYKTAVGQGELFLEKNAFHFQLNAYPDRHEERAENEIPYTYSHTYRAEFIGANTQPEIEGKKPSSYYHNYYLDKNQKNWATGIYPKREVIYQDLYNGIDLKVYSYEGSIKYDYVIAPQVNPNQIKVRYRGLDNYVIKEGKLYLSHSLGMVIEEKPYAYQVINGIKEEITCHYSLDANNILQFEFPNGYNNQFELIIDPVLIFSTYSGSTTVNFGMTATYDDLGNGYMGGVNFASGYDTTLGAFQRAFNGGNSDIVISKFSPDGTQLLFATYLGGNSSETVHSMVVDDSLNLSILGVSSSTNFPVNSNSYDTTKTISNTISIPILAETFSGGPDIVIAKFSEDGTQLIGSTYLGGNNSDGLNVNLVNPGSANLNLVYNYGDQFRGEIITDSLGNIYIGTTTHSDSLDSGGALLKGQQDGIVAKFNKDLSNLEWSKYIGGSSNDAIYSLKIINGNRILVGGGTQSFTDFPLTNGVYQGSSLQGRSDGFVCIISADGSNLERSTFISTPNYDQVYFVEFDRFGGVYALGQSFGGQIPLKNTQIADTLAGQFIMKLDNNLDSLIYSTTFGDGLVGGAINISPTAFLVDQCQNVYVSGWGGRLLSNEGAKTITTNMPLTSNAFRSTINQTDFYLYVMNRHVDSVLYGSFFGGTSSGDHVDGGTSRFDKRGVIYQSVCASCGNNNADFPTTPGAHARVNPINTGNNCNNALFKFDFEILPRAKIYTNKTVVCAPSFVNIVDSSKNAEELIWDFFGTPSLSQNLDTTIYFDSPGFYTIKQYARDTICNTIDSTEIVIEVQPNTITYQKIDDIFTCDTSRLDLTAFTNQTAGIFIWSSNPQFSDTLTTTTDSSLQVRPVSIPINYYLKLTNPGSICEIIDTIQVWYQPLSLNPTLSADTVCEGSQVQFTGNFVNAQHFSWDFDNGQSDTNTLNPLITYANPGDYTIKVLIRNDNCQASDSALLNLNVQTNKLQIQPINDSIYCGTDTLTFRINSYGTAQKFLWSNNNNYTDTLNNFPNDSTIQIFSSTNQNFYKKVSDQYCEKTSAVNIRYIPYSVELAPIPDSLCSPADIQLNSTQLGVTNFLFDFGNEITNGNNQDPLVSYLDSGTFIIQLATTNNICNRNDTLRDTIRIEPGVELNNIIDTTICFGDTISLRMNSNGTASQFIWSTSSNYSNPLNNGSDSSIRISPASSIGYYYKAARTICADSGVSIVNVQDIEVDVDDFTSICIGDTISLNALNLSGLPLNYFWSPSDSLLNGQSTNTVSISPNISQNFFLLSRTNIGCLEYDTAFVEVNTPAFESAEILSTLDSVFAGQSTQLSTNRIGSNLRYFWSPAEGLNDRTSANPIASPSKTTLYTVSIYDENTGCTIEALRRVFVYELLCDEPAIFVPTAFTPNNDGKNDILYVRGGLIKSMEWQVYNRWGELVFQSDHPSKGWDGIYKGKAADPGVFVYHLKATCFDNQNFFKKGNVTLIR